MEQMKFLLVIFVLCSIVNLTQALPSLAGFGKGAPKLEKSQPEDDKDFSLLFSIWRAIKGTSSEVNPEDFLHFLSKVENSQPGKEHKEDIREDIKDMKQGGDTPKNETMASNYFDQKVKSAFETTFNDIRDGIFNLFGRK